MKPGIYDVVIIGAGIVGCALARELASRFDSVVLLEKEAAVGFHTSGRNSGVVHSGFNPKPGTLKARLCVQGSQALRLFCAERDVPCEQVGTWVVATSEPEVPHLYDLKSRGEKNGVPGLEILPIGQVREQEPNVKGIAALFSPTGAIVDSKALTQAVAEDAKHRGANIHLGEEVVDIQENEREIEVRTQRRVYPAKQVINCAGLHADRLARKMGLARDYVIAPFRGEYFVTNRPGNPIIHSMVYHVPNLVVPFLGVHLTKTITGSVMIGPNAVPAFGREAYGKWQISIRDMFEVLQRKGFWRALTRNRALMKIAWRELRNSCSKRHFLQEASELVEGLTPESLSLSKHVGIRPQLLRSNGELVEDLVIERTPRSIHILNVVSPGMTSSLAFADWVSSGLTDDCRWEPREQEELAGV